MTPVDGDRPPFYVRLEEGGRTKEERKGWITRGGGGEWRWGMGGEGTMKRGGGGEWWRQSGGGMEEREREEVEEGDESERIEGRRSRRDF